MQRAASVPLPGHAPMDARDVHVALARRRTGRAGARPEPRRRARLHGLLARRLPRLLHGRRSREPDPGARWPFDRYVLLDPPVRLVYGLDAARPLLQRAAASTAGAARGRGAAHPAQGARTSRRSGWPQGRAPALQPPRRHRASATTSLEPAGRAAVRRSDEARYLIGLSFRRSLQSMLWVSQQREDQGVLLTPRQQAAALARVRGDRRLLVVGISLRLRAALLPRPLDT